MNSKTVNEVHDDIELAINHILIGIPNCIRSIKTKSVTVSVDVQQWGYGDPFYSVDGDELLPFPNSYSLYVHLNNEPSLSIVPARGRRKTEKKIRQDCNITGNNAKFGSNDYNRSAKQSMRDADEISTVLDVTTTVSSVTSVQDHTSSASAHPSTNIPAIYTKEVLAKEEQNSKSETSCTIS